MSDKDPETGPGVIAAALATMPALPGVYRMLDRQGQALYVGKARDLRKRLAAYTQPERLPARLRRMVAATATVEIVTTETEVEALLLAEVARLFALPAPPERIEVYDNSHIMGTNAYGVMVVAGSQGFVKAAYRKFSIRGPLAPGDDYAMLREVFARRFGRLMAERAEGVDPPAPDLVLIDGGAGPLAAATEILAGLGLAASRSGAGALLPGATA